MRKPTRLTLTRRLTSKITLSPRCSRARQQSRSSRRPSRGTTEPRYETVSQPVPMYGTVVGDTFCSPLDTPPSKAAGKHLRGPSTSLTNPSAITDPALRLRRIQVQVGACSVAFSALPGNNVPQQVFLSKAVGTLCWAVTKHGRSSRPPPSNE